MQHFNMRRCQFLHFSLHSKDKLQWNWVVVNVQSGEPCNAIQCKWNQLISMNVCLKINYNCTTWAFSKHSERHYGYWYYQSGNDQCWKSAILIEPISNSMKWIWLAACYISAHSGQFLEYLDNMFLLLLMAGYNSSWLPWCDVEK